MPIGENHPANFSETDRRTFSLGRHSISWDVTPENYQDADGPDGTKYVIFTLPNQKKVKFDLTKFPIFENVTAQKPRPERYNRLATGFNPKEVDMWVPHKVISSSFRSDTVCHEAFPEWRYQPSFKDKIATLIRSLTKPFTTRVKELIPFVPFRATDKNPTLSGSPSNSPRLN